MDIPLIPPAVRAQLLAMLGTMPAADDALIRRTAGTLHDMREHTHHPSPSEDWYCINLTHVLSNAVGPILQRLLQVEAELERHQARSTGRPMPDRGTFQAITSRADGGYTIAEEIRCTSCGAFTTQGGVDPNAWTLQRLDGLADRHHCLVAPSEESGHEALLGVCECTCVEFCDEDPSTACTLSGRRHVHPRTRTGQYGPCAVHPDAPGDL